MTRLTNALPTGLVKTQISPRFGRARVMSSMQALSPGFSVGDVERDGMEESRRDVAYETAFRANQAPAARTGSASSQRRRFLGVDGVSAILESPVVGSSTCSPREVDDTRILRLAGDH